MTLGTVCNEFKVVTNPLSSLIFLLQLQTIHKYLVQRMWIANTLLLKPARMVFVVRLYLNIDLFRIRYDCNIIINIIIFKITLNCITLYLQTIHQQIVHRTLIALLLKPACSNLMRMVFVVSIYTQI